MYDRPPMQKRERIKLIATVLNDKQETIEADLQQMDVRQLHDFVAAVEKECKELEEREETSDPELVLRQIAQTFEQFDLASPDEFPPEVSKRGSTTESEVVDDAEIDELLSRTLKNVIYDRNFAQRLEQSRKR